jgi:hypothetical protein
MGFERDERRLVGWAGAADSMNASSARRIIAAPPGAFERKIAGGGRHGAAARAEVATILARS